ncbi:MAG: hypothetical protein ACI9G5_001338 [Paracoccaceae bacterium]|jgi:hypothetical protein
MNARKGFAHWFNALCLPLALVLPQLSLAEVVREEPAALAMVTDLVLVRPVMLAITAVGSVFFVASLPFSLLGGNAGEAGDTLVVQPAANTFVRCLGCTRAGYKD